MPAPSAVTSLFEAGSQASSLSHMLTRQQLYDLLGYKGYEERDRAYFGG